jgi:hypothetical protein
MVVVRLSSSCDNDLPFSAFDLLPTQPVVLVMVSFVAPRHPLHMA